MPSALTGAESTKRSLLFIEQGLAEDAWAVQGTGTGSDRICAHCPRRWCSSPVEKSPKRQVQFWTMVVGVHRCGGTFAGNRPSWPSKITDARTSRLPLGGPDKERSPALKMNRENLGGSGRTGRWKGDNRPVIAAALWSCWRSQCPGCRRT